MRTLPSALEEAQKRAPLEWPKVRIRIRRRIGGVTRMDYDRLYEGAEPDGPHCATMPSDGSLNRFRIDPADNKLYRQRAPDPELGGALVHFGNDTPGALRRTIGQNSKGVCKFTLSYDTAAINIKSLGGALFLDCKAKAVIYADNAGAPGALLATSEEVTGIDTDVLWRTFTFTTPVTLPAATYWLGLIVGTAGYGSYGQTGASNQGAYKTDTYDDGPSNPFGTPDNYLDDELAIYATVCDWSTWADTLKTAKAVACYSYGSNVILAYIASTSPYHVWVIPSSDSGQSWGAAVDTGAVSMPTGSLAIALKADGTSLVIYTRATTVYARKRTSGVWGAESTAPYTFNSLWGLAMLYEGDWNIAITGVNTSSQDGVWSTIFGDGYSEAPNSWDDLRAVMLRESTEPFQYRSPFVAYPYNFRIFFVEQHTDPITQNRVYFSYSPASADWVSNEWREPIPFDLETQYGLAIAYDNQNVWLSTPSGVWKSDYGPAQWDITDKVVEIWETDAPNRYRSKLKIVLDNTAGLFNNFDKMGYEVVFGKGYQTSEGPLYSEGSAFQIVGWRKVSPPWFPLRMVYPVGVIGTLEIYCEGFWDLAKRYKFRRDVSWAAGEKSAGAMLNYIVNRLGFEFATAGCSTESGLFKPALTIKAGTKAYTAIKKILSWLPDVLFQRGHWLYFKELASDEAVDYDYNNFYGMSHVVYRGNYGAGAWDPNRAQVWSDTFMVEEFEFDQIQQVYDRLSKVTTPEYPDVTRAGARADADLRKGEVFHAATGWLQVPTNCGQEPFDVITISDSTAGVNNVKRRVLAVKTHWRKPWLYWQVFELGAV